MRPIPNLTSTGSLPPAPDIPSSSREIVTAASANQPSAAITGPEATIAPVNSGQAGCFPYRRAAPPSPMSYDQHLIPWMASGPVREKIARIKAAIRIRHSIWTNDPDLDLWGLQLTTLPKIPEHIRYLDICWNQLTTLPELPSGLAGLAAACNKLTSLPHLTPSMLELDVPGNFLTELPTLSPRLFSLNVNSNQLTTLPNLPNTLTRLKVSENRIATLPPLPDSLIYLEAKDNQLTTLPPISAAVAAHEFTNFSGNSFPPQVDFVLPTPIPRRWWGRAVRDWQLRHPDMEFGRGPPPASTAPMPKRPAFSRRSMGWALAPNPNDSTEEPNAKAFQTFLDLLTGRGSKAAPAEFTRKGKQSTFINRIDSLLDAMEKSPELRSVCLGIAESALSSCGDRIALAINDMELAHINDDARQGRYSDAELFTLGRGMYRLDVLEGVIAKVIRGKSRFSKNIDAVEIRLAFHTNLASRLQLPAVAHVMLYESYAHLKKEDFDNAENIVLKSQEKTGGIEFLVNWLPWQEAMKRSHPDAFSKVENIIKEEQEKFSVLPDSLSSQAQIRIYAGILSRQKKAIEDFVRTCTTSFMMQNHLL